MKYVYLINEVSTDNYKIGKATDMKNRLSGLQTGNSTTLQVLILLETCDYTLLENTLHNIFKPNNIKGEWFKFKPSILQEVVLVMHNMCIKINKEK